MSDNDSGWGPVGAIWTVLLLVFMLAACGAPVLNNSGLSWDNSIPLARTQARHAEELARIEAADAASERGAENLALFIQVVGGCIVIIVGIVGVMAVAARGFTTWEIIEQLHLQAERERTQLQLAALDILATRPGSRLEAIDGEWCVVDDARAEIIPVDRRLAVFDRNA